jgi:hypothetical protein
MDPQDTPDTPESAETPFTDQPIPQKYLRYIIPFKSGYKDKRSGKWVELPPTPYMQVHGRIQWALDEHRESGNLLSITTEILSHDNRLVMRATVHSMHGLRTGHAEIEPGEDGIKKAETSAIGRALAMLGYGLINGLASYEDIQAWRDREGEAGPQEPRSGLSGHPVPDMTQPPARSASHTALVQEFERECAARQFLPDRVDRWVRQDFGVPVAGMAQEHLKVALVRILTPPEQGGMSAKRRGFLRGEPSEKAPAA